MTKSLALLLDSYRQLNAKRLFWIVLAVSGLVVAVFAVISADGDRIMFLWWRTPFHIDMLAMIDPAFLYKEFFTLFGVNIWLSWIANILALASTAGIFPDFLADGAIDLYLSKPISRLRLFFMRYMGGLLFVVLQVTIFSAFSFLVLGWRGKIWAPSVFLAIPIVALVFSYLFSICVLFGILTRSTVAALLLTLVSWVVISGVQGAETYLLREMIASDLRVASIDRQIAKTQSDLDHFSTTRPTSAQTSTGTLDSLRTMMPFGLFSGRVTRGDLVSQITDLKNRRERTIGNTEQLHDITLDALVFLPKTSGTTQLLDRIMLSDEEKAENERPEPPPLSLLAPEAQNGEGRPRRERRAELDYLQRASDKIHNRRSAVGLLASSVAFECVILGIAAWIFNRRDY